MTRTIDNIVRGNKHLQKPTAGTSYHLPEGSYLSGVHSAWPSTFRQHEMKREWERN